jgi:hypothetical protein
MHQYWGKWEKTVCFSGVTVFKMFSFRTLAMFTDSTTFVGADLVAGWDGPVRSVGLAAAELHQD